MITVLPDRSFQLPPLTDQLELSHSQALPPPKEIKLATRKRLFSAPNIIITLIFLCLVVGSAYLYLGNSVAEKGSITEVQKSLLDISQLEREKPKINSASIKPIMNPSDGSSKSSAASSNKASSANNDKSNRHTKPIQKGESGTIIGSGGSGNPGDDEGDDEEDKDKKKQNQKDIFGSNQQEESEEEDSKEEDDIVNDMQENWMRVNEDIPLLGKTKN